jgi:hypothetical protein
MRRGRIMTRVVREMVAFQPLRKPGFPEFGYLRDFKLNIGWQIVNDGAYPLQVSWHPNIVNIPGELVCCPLLLAVQCLFNHLSDLEAYRGPHADRAHSMHGFLDLLLNFAKKTYTFSAESYSTPATGSSNSPSLPPLASNDFLTLSQPASKIADLNLEKFWDEKGWEHIIFDSEDAAPGLSSRLHPLDSFDSGSSEMSRDNASSGTLFESGSEISSDAESIVEQVNETEEAGLAANCRVYRHPATPPASPEPSTPAAQSDQGNEMQLSSGIARALENALKDARSADS